MTPPLNEPHIDPQLPTPAPKPVAILGISSLCIPSHLLNANRTDSEHRNPLAALDVACSITFSLSIISITFLVSFICKPTSLASIRIKRDCFSKLQLYPKGAQLERAIAAKKEGLFFIHAIVLLPTKPIWFGVVNTAERMGLRILDDIKILDDL
jgi:hypothetical protein